jgi:hypothetical protein
MFYSVAPMMQLSFQPAFDPFHTVFRFLRLNEIFSTKEILFPDQLRILDFYLLFPFRIDEIRLPNQHRAFKQIAKKYENVRPYGNLPEDNVLFRRMKPIQYTALETLADRNFLDKDLFFTGKVKAGGKNVPLPLLIRIQEINEIDRDLINFLKFLVQEYPFMGVDGLKHRTKLMEYRYDAV